MRRTNRMRQTSLMNRMRQTNRMRRMSLMIMAD
jgi:hypothetical protein